MTHKISPLAFRLGVSSSWLSTSHLSSFNLSPVLHSDLFFRSFIQGILFKFSIFSSPIILLRSPSGSLHIHLFFWDASPSLSFDPLLNFPQSLRPSLFNLFKSSRSKKLAKIKLLSFLIHSLLCKLFNLDPLLLHLHFSEIPSPVFNAKILCDYMAYRISLNPYYHKSVVLEALRASKVR